MKYYPIWILTLLCLCWSCNSDDQKHTVKLDRELTKTELISVRFDSLVGVTVSLPSEYALPLLLKMSEKQATNPAGFRKIEKCLLYAYNMASYKEKKKILYQMIVFYYEKMYCFAPELETYALTEGYRRCRELEHNYTLTDKEWEDFADRKAEYLRWMKQYEDALQLYFQILAIHRKNDDADKMISCLRAISALYMQMKDKQESRKIDMEAYNIALQKGMTTRQEGLLGSLSELAYIQGNYNESLVLLKKRLEIIRKSELRHIYIKMAKAYTEMDSLDEARYYLRKTLILKNPDGKAENYHRIADTFIREEKEDSATYYILQAQQEFKIYRKTQNPGSDPSQKLPYNALPVCVRYARLLEKNGKNDEALKALNMMYPIIYGPLAIYNQKNVTDALNTYTSLYRKTGEYSKAFESLRLRDSIQNEYNQLEKEENFVEITSLFKNRELVKSIDWQEKQLRNSNHILLLTLFLIIALAGTTAIFWWMYAQKKKQLSVIFGKQQEIDNLRKQQVAKSVTLTPEEELFMKLERVLTGKELFRDPNMSLDRISQYIDTNRSYISSSINTCAKRNFNQWLNSHRIAYVLERLDPTTDMTTLFTDAGFSSSASFYRSFKQYTSMSPKQYMEQQEHHKPTTGQSGSEE